MATSAGTRFRRDSAIGGREQQHWGPKHSAGPRRPPRVQGTGYREGGGGRWEVGGRRYTVGGRRQEVGSHVKRCAGSGPVAAQRRAQGTGHRGGGRTAEGTGYRAPVGAQRRATCRRGRMPWATQLGKAGASTARVCRWPLAPAPLAPAAPLVAGPPPAGPRPLAPGPRPRQRPLAMRWRPWRAAGCSVASLEAGGARRGEAATRGPASGDPPPWPLAPAPGRAAS